jgi:hypothetical protein
MPPMPLSYNLAVLKAWAEKSGIPFQGTPQAKNTQPYDGRSVCLRCNTCEICPTGARYSPDFTFKQLLAAKKIDAARSDARPPARRVRIGKRIVSATACRAPSGRGRVPREDVRPRVGLRLVAAPAAAVGRARTVRARSGST